MEIVLIVVALIVFVLLMRIIGAWMLRINEVITLLQDIRKELRTEKEKQ